MSDYRVRCLTSWFVKVGLPYERCQEIIIGILHTLFWRIFYDSNEFFHSFLGKTMKTYKTYGSKNVKKCHFSLSTFKGYLSGTQNPKFSKIRRALSKNSTTMELLKCIEIGLVKAYIKAKQLRTLETVVRSRIHNVSFYFFMSGFGWIFNLDFFHQKNYWYFCKHP